MTKTLASVLSRLACTSNLFFGYCLTSCQICRQWLRPVNASSSQRKGHAYMQAVEPHSDAALELIWHARSPMPKVDLRPIMSHFMKDASYQYRRCCAEDDSRTRFFPPFLLFFPDPGSSLAGEGAL